MNFFSSPEYLTALAESYFPGKRFTFVHASIAGSVYQLLNVSGRLVPWVPFMDFLEPVHEQRAETRVAHLPAVLLRKLDAATYRAQPRVPGEQPSPTVDFTRFASWDALVAYAKAQNPPGFRSSLQKQKKKLEETHGAVRFQFEDPDPDALRVICDWKSAQYRGAGYPDGFRSPKLRRHFELLQQRGLLTVSTLRVGDTLAAGHIGIVWQGRLYYWLPAYDVKFGNFSVGALVLEHIMQESFARGHQELDFLLGNETYKWSYATDVRVIGEVGQRPLRQRLWQPVRARVLTEVKKNAGLYTQLQSLKRRALEWKISR